jgi:hypothetical protein
MPLPRIKWCIKLRDWMKSLSGKYMPAGERNKGRKMEIYRNGAASVEERVKDLISRMTLEEKIAQLGSVFAPPLLEKGKFAPDKVRKILKNGIGHISAIAMTSTLPLREVTALANDIQKYLLEGEFEVEPE